MGLVMRHAAMLTAFGLALGLAGAVAATRFMSALLFGVQPNDRVSLAGAAASLGIVAMVAAWVPPDGQREWIRSLRYAWSDSGLGARGSGLGKHRVLSRATVITMLFRTPSPTPEPRL